MVHCAGAGCLSYLSFLSRNNGNLELKQAKSVKQYSSFSRTLQLHCFGCHRGVLSVYVCDARVGYCDQTSEAISEMLTFSTVNLTAKFEGVP